MEFLRIAHVLSTIGSWCFIGSVVTFAFFKRPYSTTWLRCQNQNLFKKVGIINDWPFLYRHFCMKIDRIFNNCSCFIDYRLFVIFLPLTRGRIALQKNVDRIKIGLKTVGVIHERPFFHRLFSMKIDGIFKNCSCFIDYRLLMLYRIRCIFCI